MRPCAKSPESLFQTLQLWTFANCESWAWFCRLTTSAFLCFALSFWIWPCHCCPSRGTSKGRTYRLMFDQYVLLTMGVNTKKRSARKDLSIYMYSFRSSFIPLGFALANKENENAYTHFGSTLFKVAQALGHDLRPGHILQWHGDMHLGIEAARKNLAPESTRLADWAHVTGAIHPKGRLASAGFLSKELALHARKTTLPWILQWCRISKQLSALVFHVVWTSKSSLPWRQAPAHKPSRSSKSST